MMTAPFGSMFSVRQGGSSSNFNSNSNLDSNFNFFGGLASQNVSNNNSTTSNKGDTFPQNRPAGGFQFAPMLETQNTSNPQTTTSRQTNSNQMVQNPENLGFRRIGHARRRGKPKFLLSQQPHLKPRPFVQDHWDKINQQRMLRLEDTIEDLNELYEKLKAIREMERKVMEEKNLVDKAESSKTLDEAIDFRGTCQDMCPTFERARRNVEYTVFSYEKENANDKKASRWKALKVFARPAAAAAPPLPSDVRPPHVLVKTLDYIVDNLLTTLPESEAFLWDRMRSIRQDFTYQNYCGPEAVDCNERIVRIHLLILHIMLKSRTNFVLQQELEQLHKSLITLSEIYDDVRASAGECPNEAEFRAYILLSKIRDPQYDRGIQELPQHIFQDERVQLAICFRRIMSNSTYSERGHIRTESCLNLFSRFFELLQSPKVPFLMSSFLQIYVNEVRFYAMKALSLSFNRKLKPVPFTYFMEQLLFNDVDELKEFCDYYSIKIVDNKAVDLKTLAHHSHHLPEKKPLRMPILSCVDAKLDGIPLPQVINSGKPNDYTISDSPRQTSWSTGSIPSSTGGATYSTGPAIFNRLGGKSTTIPPQTTQVLNAFNSQKTSSQPISLQDVRTTIDFPINSKSNKDIGETTDNRNRDNNGTGTGYPSKGLESSEPKIESAKIQENVVPTTEQSEDTKTPRETFVFGQTDTKKSFPSLTGSANVPVQSSHTEYSLGERKEREKTNFNLQQTVADTTKAVSTDKLKANADEKQLLKQKEKNKELLVDSLAKGLYQAFIHERLFLMYLQVKASVQNRNRLKRCTLLKWESRYHGRLEGKAREKKRRDELRTVERELGVPSNTRRSWLWTTPTQGKFDLSQFSTVKRKNTLYSPVRNEENNFSQRLVRKKSEMWKPLDLKKLYFEEATSRLPQEQVQVSQIYLYAKNWSSISSLWLLNKFNLSNAKVPATVTVNHATFKIGCISENTPASKYANVQLLVFSTGITDKNIFDLEMKMQQDGEELVRLITDVSLNNNIHFNLLVIYWESSDTHLTDSKIAKLLRLNRIDRSFGNILDNIGFIKITSDSPDKSLEQGLIRMSKSFEYKVAERGKTPNTPIEGRATMRTTQNGKREATKSVDERMAASLELERKKYREELTLRNMAPYLQDHINASPRVKKRKLPVLLSETKTTSFKTPLGTIGTYPASSSSSSSSIGLSSYLVTKVRGTSKNYPTSEGLPLDTPSRTVNIPELSRLSHETPVLNGIAATVSFGDPSDVSFAGTTAGPRDFHVPTGPTTPTSRTSKPYEYRTGANKSMSSELKQLKSLIASVRDKIGNQ